MRIALPHVDLDALAVVLYAKYQKQIDGAITFFEGVGDILKHPLAYYLAALQERRLGNLDTFERMDFEIEERKKGSYEI